MRVPGTSDSDNPAYNNFNQDGAPLWCTGFQKAQDQAVTILGARMNFSMQDNYIPAAIREIHNCTWIDSVWRLDSGSGYRETNARTPSDMIAAELGIKELVPAYLDPSLQIKDLSTSASFASGGTGYDPQTSKLVGANDIANTYFTLKIRSFQYDILSYADLLIASASDSIQEIYKLGARRIGVFGVPPVGCLLFQRTLAGGARICVDTYNQAVQMYNSKLSSQLNFLGNSLPQSKTGLGLHPEDLAEDTLNWNSAVKKIWSLLSPLIFSDHHKRPGVEDPSSSYNMVRNVPDMNARFCSFNSALLEAGKSVWVMNVVPTGPNYLPLILDRGSVGVLHDWCEAFSTYPRTYDMVHAAGLLSVETVKKWRYYMQDLFSEIVQVPLVYSRSSSLSILSASKYWRHSSEIHKISAGAVLVFFIDAEAGVRLVSGNEFFAMIIISSATKWDTSKWDILVHKVVQAVELLQAVELQAAAEMQLQAAAEMQVRLQFQLRQDSHVLKEPWLTGDPWGEVFILKHGELEPRIFAVDGQSHESFFDEVGACDME
ncbi:hypothetical protein POM88_005116 [Heracleum sosnowskyi]|uniref:Methyltransferase n=1 Tax=Heracleum sosnowskyi TaxID=360622 RepID=A0AAD8NET7_9APIA|nr:hypothetical protein POM88_005116 [Heracleum sosnowskyi]